jgi:hypothetical protein
MLNEFYDLVGTDLMRLRTAVLSKRPINTLEEGTYATTQTSLLLVGHGFV